MTKQPSKKKKATNSLGFTLIVTVVMMVLLTLIAIGIMSLSSITLRSSSQASAMKTARQNARLGLMIALGQLQKQTGIDQRVTATADLAASVNGGLLPNGAAPTNMRSINGVDNGLKSVVSGTRYWTGVWKNANTPNDIYNRTPSASLVSWLVSGNEIDSTAPSIKPDFSGAALDNQGNPSDPSVAVVLAGTKTVGSNPMNFVSAPLVKVSAANNAGRYAWWVGDEGVKSRINIPLNPTDKSTQPVAHRGAWEVNTDFETYPTPNSPKHAELSQIHTLGSAAILDPKLATSGGANTALFHSATTDSFGVLSDVLSGGLRIDLTACLERGFPASGASTFHNRAEANRNILHSQMDRRFASMRGPRWDTLRNFYNVAREANEKGKLIVKAAAGSSSSTSGPVTIAPIVLDFRVVLGARLLRVRDNNCKLNPCAKVSISLANPYPYPLEWEEDLEFELIDETPNTNGSGTMVYDSSANPGARFLGRKTSQGEPAVLNNAIFVIPKGSIPAGEARAYLQSRYVKRPLNDLGVAKIPMGAFSASSAGNFEICVEMESPDTSTEDYTTARLLDVRESWTTSQPSLELRLAGSSSSSGNVLRRIERFEWDNASHAATKLTIRHDGVVASLNEQVKMPFPLKIYNTQISMPGMRYENMGLPHPSMLGTRCSTLRTFTDFNLRAVRFPKLITSYYPPPYYFDQADNAVTDIPPTRISSSLPSQTGQAFTQNLAINPLPWGHSLVNSQTNRCILFSFPQQFVSLAQLQHVDLTGDDNSASVSQQPGNAVGNSYATPFVKRGQAIQIRKNYIVSGINTNDINASSTNTPTNYYDMSYLLNVALWDTYFFSSMGGESSASVLGPANPAITVPRMPKDAALLNDPIRASSHLLVRGSFNIQSTSKDAWKAILASTRFTEHRAGGDASTAMFPRSMEQQARAEMTVTGKGPDSYSGYRRLTPAQIDALAEEIVRQVRQRGPFLSVSHFVNRALSQLDAAKPTNTALSRAGALQSAIDLSGINISPDGSKKIFSDVTVAQDRLTLQAEGNRPKADVLYPPTAGFPANQANGSRGSTYGGTEDDGSEVWAPFSADLNPGAVASIYADRLMLTNDVLKAEQGFRSTGIPGWLTQADVLQAIGPVISARSDTFRIRAYGEAVSAEDSSKVLAKAWCEAIVQRTPNYVDIANTPEQRDVSSNNGPITQINRRFGRRYEIVNFRWLNANEI